MAEARKFGTIEVAPLALGGNVFGWTADEAASFAVLDAFVDRGFNLIDTANMYSTWVPGHSGGESESVIGKWLAQSGKRDKVVLATKVGMPMGDGSKGLSAKYIRAEVENSLRRLGTDHIDLYQAHCDDQQVPLEETLGIFEELIDSGKVRQIGASNYVGKRLRQAMETSRRENLAAYATLQPEYNLHSRKDYEADLAPAVAEYGLAVMPYFSLASGFLTGKYKTKEDAEGKNRGPMVQKYFDERGTKILAALEKVSNETGEKQASISLAWLLSRPGIAAPIASATSVDQLAAVLRGAELQLSTEHLKDLDDASAY